MEIYDKAQWHIDGGEEPAEVVRRVQSVFAFLREMDMLSPDGLEILDLGVDDSVSLHERLVNESGKALLSAHYDDVIDCSADQIANRLRAYWDQSQS